MLMSGLFPAAGVAASRAQAVTVGLLGSPTSFDPHFHAHAPSIALHRHVFETLVTRHADMVLSPCLAADWAPLASSDGWEFRMNPAARFHDGTPVTAADAAASLERAMTIPNSPGRWSLFVTEIARTEVVDAGTLRIHTHGPAPLLPDNLPSILIIPERIARVATTADFNSGRAAIGSGPYRLRSYTPRETVELEGDPGWWQRDQAPPRPEPWARVIFRVIPNDSARVAALIAGDVDLIEVVPTADVARLETTRRIVLARVPSVRFLYIAFDQARDASPGVADAEGRPMARNPLKDVRVRRALSHAINREGIVAQVMEGQAVATGQMLPRDLPSAVPDLPPDPFDPAAARRLLTEAGWGGGFSLRLLGPNDRLANDERILQAVAQMWGRIGVRTQVEAMPTAAYLSRFTSGAFSAALGSWGTALGEPNTYFTALLAKREATRGRGAMNPTGYSNPALDALMERALTTRDSASRHALWREATRLALVEDAALLPLHYQVNIWAMREGLAYVPRADELIDITGLSPAAAR
jgi:peptide/nickel transport system substrate-binding protein